MDLSALRNEIESQTANSIINSIPAIGIITSEMIFLEEQKKLKESPLTGVLHSVSCAKKLNDPLMSAIISGGSKHERSKKSKI